MFGKGDVIEFERRRFIGTEVVKGIYMGAETNPEGIIRSIYVEVNGNIKPYPIGEIDQDSIRRLDEQPGSTAV